MKDKIKKIICNLDLWIAGAALVILVVLTFANVIMRRGFNSPIQWTEEMQKACFIWIIYMGAGPVFRNGGHVAIDIIVDLFPKKVQHIIEGISTVITVYVLGNLCCQSFELVMQFYHTGRVTNLLKIPLSLVYSAMPIGCVIMIVSVIWVEYQKIKAPKETGEGDES